MENLADRESVMHGDILEYTKNYKCLVGIAHTDLFKFIKNCTAEKLT